MTAPVQTTSHHVSGVTGSLRHNLGFNGRADYDRQRARTLWLSSLELLENAEGKELTKLARFLSHLASVYEERGDYAKTERLYQRLTKLVERTGVDPELENLRVVVLRRLGSLYQAQGRLDEAENMLRRALVSSRAIFGEQHSETGETFHHLALLEQGRGRYDRAAKYYRSALAIFELTLDASYLRVADLCRDLGILECKRGNPAAGEPMARRALQIRLVALGKKHLSVAAEMTSLAAIQAEQDKFEEAERLYTRAIKIIEANCGPAHYEIAKASIKLAAIQVMRGDFAAAEQCYLRALAIKERLLGVENLEVASLRNDLAALYARQCRHNEAAALSKIACQVFEKATGPLEIG